MEIRVLDERPALAPLYVKAALPALPGASRLPGVSSSPRGQTLPDLRLELPAVAPDDEHLDAYREVCAFPVSSMLPATYPHVLAFPLQLMLMTDQAFPFAAMGAVHIQNRIEQRRPVAVHETLGLAVWAERLAPHRSGRTATIVSQATVGGEVVWRGETVLLGRGPGSDTATQLPADVPTEAPLGPRRWSLPSGLGRSYAAVSGDRNPIHLYDVTAKAFGFRHHIAHGMWTKARCLGALGSRLPDSFAVEVAFKRPIELPGTVGFGTRQADTFLDFGVRSSTDTPYLLGRLTRF